MNIEDGIPIPPKRGQSFKYPLAELKPSQSFFVPEADGKKRQGIARHILKIAQRMNVSMTTRIMPDGVRAWRTE